MKLTLLFFIGLILTSLSVPINATTETIYSDVLDGKNTTRLENYLVYYSYTSTGRTPVNQWGYEVSVNKNNVVVEAATNVTILPGGYAISAHGTKKVGLMEVKIGDLVTINPDTSEIVITRDSLMSSIYKAQINQEKANLLYENAKNGFYSYDEDKVKTTIDTIDRKYQEMVTLSQNPTTETINQLKTLADEVNDLTLNVIYMTSKSNNIEIRALWHRPNATKIKENNLDGVKKFVARVKELGFNTLYVETLWNGYVSYRSDLLETHPQVATFYYGEEYQYDYIAALIGEANKLGIDVHAWNHTFNAGGVTKKATAVKDEWLVETYQGDTLHPNPYGGAYYMDPSNEEVLDFVENVFKEMLTKYNFAGIQFDYIRYYDNNYSQTPIRDSGYGPLPEAKFKEAYNLEGDVRTLILNPDIREKWNKWRQDNVTEAVRRISTTLREINKDVIISADVVPSINQAKATYMQDWKSWVDKGYIDLLCPMIYTGSSEGVFNQSEAIKNSLGNLGFLSSGIAPVYYGYSTLTNHYQIEATSNTGGAAIFASHNVIGNTEVEESLKLGVYREGAISPFSSGKDLLEAFYNYELSYLNLTSLSLKDHQHYSMFVEKLEEIKDLDAFNPSDYQNIISKLEFYSNLTAYLNNDAISNNIKDRINNLIDIFDIKISRELYSLGYYDPTDGPRPNPDDFEYVEEEPNPIDDEPSDEPSEDENEESRKGCLNFSIVNSSIVLGLGLIFILRRRKGDFL